MADGQEPKQESGPEPVKLPVEVEIYIEADGSVTFADLAADVLGIAHELNPDQPIACAPESPSRCAEDRPPAGTTASGATGPGERQEQQQDA